MYRTKSMMYSGLSHSLLLTPMKMVSVKSFIKRYTAERTNKAEKRLGEQSEKAENYWENLWNEIQLKEP